MTLVQMNIQITFVHMNSVPVKKRERSILIE